MSEKYSKSIQSKLKLIKLIVVAILFFICVVPSSASASTLYFNAAVNTIWNTLGNWFTDSGFTIPAVSIPANGDTVYIESNVITGPSSSVTLANLFVAQNANADLATGDNITVTGTTTIGVTGLYSGTLSNIIVSNTVFYGESYKNGTVTGNTTFNDSSYNANTVTGNATFNDTSYNLGTVTGNATFNDSSRNDDGLVTGNATFNDSSYNEYGAIEGNVVFNDTSYNFSGVVGGDATFNTTYYDAIVPSDGIFNVSYGGIFSLSEVTGTIYGSDDQAITTYILSSVGNNYNAGPIDGNIIFDGDISEYSSGVVSGTKTRHYTENTTVTRDFVLDGPWTVVSDGSGVVVDVIGAIYDETTTFLGEDGGTFIPEGLVVEEESLVEEEEETPRSGGSSRRRVVSPPPSSPPTPSSFPPLSRTLTLDSEGDDVKSLQEFLVVKGYLVIPPGIFYGYFGPLTQAALVRYQTDSGITPVSVPTNHSFSRDLSFGSEGTDVKALQQFLNTHGYPVSLFGNGSLGFETSYFGPSTRAALIRFQQAHGITPSVGYFGPKTRAVVSR